MKANPYVGPRPFERGDQPNFYGRNREARELRALVVAEREVLFYAQSGAGKTSLLNAQVIPALEDKGFHVLPLARVSSELPSGVDAQAVDNIFIFSALLALAGQDADPQALLDHTLASFLQAHYPEPEDPFESHPPVLILDQFEELFTTHRDRWRDAEGFFHQVRDALDTLSSLGVVFAMREDHVAEVDPYAPMFPRRLRARFRMERLGPSGALAAVKRPAKRAGCPFAPGVAERLVDDLRRTKVQRYLGGGKELTVEGPFVEPVQLQVVCNRLWANLPDDKTDPIQWSEVEQYGDIDRALTDFYESALSLATRQAKVNERTLRRWFGQQLITPMGSRGLALRGPDQTAGLPNPAVDALEAQHLIRADVRAGARWYELAHDRLVEPIQRSNQAWEVANETPLRMVARQWEKTGDESLLYRGTALDEAQAWASANPNEATPLETRFLQASQQAQQKRDARARRLRRIMLVGLALISLVMAALTVWAFSERQAAQQAEADAERQAGLATSRQLAVQSSDQLNENWNTALLLAIEAGHVAGTAEAASALHQALAQAERPLLVLQGSRAWWSTDGSRILTAGWDSSLKVRDADTGTELSSLSGHTELVWQARWNADESLILTASEDSTARVWDAETGDELLRLSNHTEKVERAAWNPDESLILTASSDGTARVWDAVTGAELLTLAAADGPVRQAVWNSDGGRILTAGEGGVRVWSAPGSQGETQAGAELVSLPGDWGRWSPDESQILTADSGGTIWLWDARTGAKSLTLSGHQAPIWDVAWSPDGNLILSASEDSTARVWNAKTGDKLHILGDHQQTVWQVSWNTQGSRILTASSDGTARVWDTPSGVEIFSLNNEAAVWQAAWSPDESRILTASEDDKVRIWSLPSMTENPVSPLLGEVGEVIQATHNAARSLMLTASSDGVVRLWQLSRSTGPSPDTTQAPVSGQMLLAFSGHQGPVTQAAWNADESHILSAGEDGTVRIWDPQTGAERLTLPGIQAWWGPDGDRVLTVNQDRTSQVWHLSGSAEQLSATEGVQIATESGQGILSAVWSADGARILATSQDDTARVWSVETGGVVLSLQAHQGELSQAIWNADESRILTADKNGTARVWDAQTGAELVLLSGHTGSIRQATWSPDESRILTASSDGTARVWDAQTGEELFSLPGHTAGAKRAIWNADGSQIMTVDQGATVRVWQAESGTEAYALNGHEKDVFLAIWNADESRILTGSKDGTLRYWHTQVDALVQEACQHTHRNLTQAEWTRFMGTQPYEATCPDKPAPEENP